MEEEGQGEGDRVERQGEEEVEVPQLNKRDIDTFVQCARDGKINDVRTILSRYPHIINEKESTKVSR